MKQKTSFTAFLFIFVVAFVFAGFFTIAGVLVWKLVKSSSKDKSAQAVATATTQPSGQPAARRTAGQAVNVARAASGTSASSQPKPVLVSQARARFDRGLQQCLEKDVFPCAWQDMSSGVIKNFSISKKDSFVLRNIHSMDDRPLSQTAVSQTGDVLLYRENNATWFFDKAERVRHIEVGAVARAGADDPHNSYFYDVNGQLNSCVCADKTRNCCADAPQLEPGRTRYCELFPLDAEFCAK